MQIVSDSSETTEALGTKLGANLHGGEVIELRSDVGGGKTTLVRGIARGMGSSDNVGSPSFTISREYKAGGLILHHYDFYRLGEAGLMAQELGEVLTDPGAVVVVEWAGIVEDVLPNPHVVITLVPTGESSRILSFDVPESLAYLAEQLQ